MLLWLWWILMMQASEEHIVILYKKNDWRAYMYVLTNIYRSIFPVMHYTNTCMFSLCSLGLERSLSTVAEMAFVSQIVDWFEISSGYKVLTFCAIGSAEVFCWIGIVSGVTYWHALEESIWCLSAFGLFCNLNWRRGQEDTHARRTAMYLLGGYILYMTAWDIPMYLQRPNSTKKEILVCENISTDIEVWYESLLWMTGYFIIGSKISLKLA
jgi:hypothetical protein